MNKNLLILGAGQYSFVVREIAEAMGCFEKISMLDDNNGDALGKIEEYEKFINEYTYAAVSIGSNPMRIRLLKQLFGTTPLWIGATC